MAAVVQQPAQRHVVDVVPGRLRERTGLPPAGQPAIDESRIAHEADVRPKPEPLRDARPEALDQSVCALDQSQHQLCRAGLLQVHRNRALAAPRDVVLRLGIERQRAALAIDQHDVGAEVGEQHAAERRGADAGEFDDAHTRERTHQSDLATISFMISLAPP